MKKKPKKQLATIGKTKRDALNEIKRLMRKPLHMNVIPNEKWARLWLAQRNTLARILDRVADDIYCGTEESESDFSDALTSVVDAIDVLREPLAKLKEEVSYRDEFTDFIREVASDCAGRYTAEGTDYITEHYNDSFPPNTGHIQCDKCAGLGWIDERDARSDVDTKK